MYEITLLQLSLILLPVIMVGVIYHRWVHDGKGLYYAVFRMIVQLMLIGYVLMFLFEHEASWLTILVMIFMISVSSWIALRPMKHLRRKYYGKVFIAIALGSSPILGLVIWGVLRLEPWYSPRYVVTIAGMIFSYAMNSISLCADRFFSEVKEGKSYDEARKISYRTALLPLINSFFAVGLVSIPGMMTGQILAGQSPLSAVRYQIMVMCMLLGSSGLSTALFLKLIQENIKK